MKDFDLKLNHWGPYNKEYLGVSHIANKKLGSAFRVELFPGFFRRKILTSHSSSDDGLKIFGANPELTRFSYRYELEWKDRIYCDANFVITGDNRCDITCSFVNNTDLPQSVNLNLCASLQYPIIKDFGIPTCYRIPFEPKLPEECVFIDAIDYSYIFCKENLASDGRYLGERFYIGATGNSTALGEEFFTESSHFVAYEAPINSSGFLIRYTASKDTEIKITVGEQIKSVELPASSDFSAVYINCPVTKNEIIRLYPTGCAIDSLVFGNKSEKTRFEKIPVSTEARRTVGENYVTLNYPYVDSTYKIEWHEPIQMLRRFYCTDIGDALSRNIHNHVSEEIRTPNSLGVFENFLSEPLFLEPHSTKSLHFTVSSGTSEYADEAPKLYGVLSNPDGKTYEFSQNMMAYNTLLNVVYPIYTRRGYIRHNTPGRIWDCLYSWDSGFIGMGLGLMSFERAFDCLNTYLTPVGDRHSPYIFHGSVVPTQIFLYKYLFDKYPSERKRLLDLYPMIYQLFSFYANMDERSGQMQSKLLKTWDIFYNSGGWDDYPPQKFLHNGNSEERKGASTDNTSPVITTAVTVLIAKILRSISDVANLSEKECFEQVIKKYSEPILKYAWNDNTGYFSYVVHGEDGMPKKFLSAPDGSDYNLGFDGIYPYIAGITTKEQDSKILDNILNGLMTDIGISVVDTRASYYSENGYWNGSVWMPHQWILWTSLFDKGEGELAFKIADTALKIWKRETDESYSCFEHFMKKNGRGSGFHQFSGLSTPVLLFFESYYTPGTVTLGFETVIIEKEFNDDYTEFSMKCRASGEKPIALICLNAHYKYEFYINSRPAKAKSVTDGAYEISLPNGISEIEIKKSKGKTFQNQPII
jgi:hypothetical protein